MQTPRQGEKGDPFPGARRAGERGYVFDLSVPGSPATAAQGKQYLAVQIV
jgi:hypothetical protein